MKAGINLVNICMVCLILFLAGDNEYTKPGGYNLFRYIYFSLVALHLTNLYMVFKPNIRKAVPALVIINGLISMLGVMLVVVHLWPNNVSISYWISLPLLIPYGINLGYFAKCTSQKL